MRLNSFQALIKHKLKRECILTVLQLKKDRKMSNNNYEIKYQVGSKSPQNKNKWAASESEAKEMVKAEHKGEDVKIISCIKSGG